MRRRTYLLGCVTAAAGLAGCSAIGGNNGDSGSDDGSADENGSTDDGIDDDSTGSSPEDGGGSSGPAGAATDFFEAMSDGDQAAANELLHSDSPVGQVGESQVETYQSADAAVEGATVTSSGNDEATVEVDVSVESSDGSETRTLEVVLRTEDGEWRVYEDPNSTGSGSSVPSVALDVEFQTNANERITAIEFTVQSTDTAIDPSTLSVQGQGQEATVSNDPDALVAGDTMVASFDGDGSSVTTGTTVQLVWSAPSDGSSTALTKDDLPNDATGSLANVQIES